MKEPRLRIRIEKCYRVSIVDNKDKEYDWDWEFGTREDAKRTGEKMLRRVEEAVSSAREKVSKDVADMFLCAMNKIGGY